MFIYSFGDFFVTNPPSEVPSAISWRLPVCSFDSSGGGFTKPPSVDSGGGMFLDLTRPIVVIITNAKIIMKIICGYASALGRSHSYIGYVASTAAANPLGIIEFVTALSSRRKSLC